jgi:hypothetical protein
VGKGEGISMKDEVPQENKTQTSEDTPKVAVFCAHGMGQQIPFLTIDQITQGFVRYYDLDPETVRVGKYLVDDKIHRRAEFMITDKDGQAVEMHVYEGYWAPLTEGRIYLKEVIAFLLEAGFNGLKQNIQHFKRYMFGNFVDLPIIGHPRRDLAIILAALFTLIGINAILASVLGIKAISLGLTLFQLEPVELAMTRFGPLLKAFSALFSLISLLAVPLAVFFMIVSQKRKSLFNRKPTITVMRRVPKPGAEKRDETISDMDLNESPRIDNYQAEREETALIWKRLPQIAWLVLLAVGLIFLIDSLVEQLSGNSLQLYQVIGARFWIVFPLFGLFWLVFASLTVLAYWKPKSNQSPSQNKGWKMINGVLLSSTLMWFLLLVVSGCAMLVFLIWDVFGQQSFAGSINQQDFLLRTWYLALVWAPLLYISQKMSKLLVQYVGDVAAYVSSYKLDRFYDIRSEIKKVVTDNLKAIYAQEVNKGDFLYKRVGLMGHSLGSVVIYDALNALINHDEVNGAGLGILERTKVLVTFGSPLDKTAFIFRRVIKPIREKMAESVQPLIADYANRTFKWFNVYNKRDIIAGSLEFYDLPNSKEPGRVVNLEDNDALIPVLAHNEYWENRVILSVY